MPRDTRIYLAWVTALIATLGSLYFSEIQKFNPCPLCWYQRICMYPLVVILGIAAFRSDYGARKYALSLAVIGWSIALYQNLETWGVVKAPAACTINPGARCDAKWPIWGMESPLNETITIPVLSMIAFTIIIALLTVGWKRPVEDAAPTTAL